MECEQNSVKNRNQYGLTDIYLQATSHCNLDCRYCYLPSVNRLVKNRMSIEAFDRIIDHVQANIDPSQIDKAQLTWHSGEPLSRGLSFFKYAANKIKANLPGIRQQVQTNATLVNDNFCKFFKTHDYKIGVSIDGPKELHNFNRVYRTQLDSFDSTVQGIKKLRDYDIPLTFISVVSRNTMLNANPGELLDFLFQFHPKEVGFSIEEIDGSHSGSDLHTKEIQLENRAIYRKFLYTLFEAAGEKGMLNKVREFKNPYRKLTVLTQDPTIKFKSSMIEPFAHVSYDYEGNFTCFSPELLAMTQADGQDFFFGNVFRKTDAILGDVATRDKFREVRESILSGVRKCAETCEYYGYCPGGVPSNKLAENGTFDSTETFTCQTSVMDSIEVTSQFLSQYLENQKAIK